MKRTFLIISLIFSVLVLSAQEKFKQLPESLRDQVSRKDFRRALKAYEGEVQDSLPIVLDPIERIKFDEQPIGIGRMPGILSVDSYGREVLMPDAIRDWVIEDCGNYPFVVCTVDSGTDPNHIEYRGGWWMTPSNYSGDPEQHWHGTHVSGIIWQMVGELIQKRGNGKMKDIQILNSSGSGSFTNATQMVIAETKIFEKYADQGAGVIFNNSWGYNGPIVASFDREVEKSVDAGLIWISSAGNSGKEGDGYPAMSDHILSTASLSQNLRRSSFSTMNDKVDLATPGSQINSTLPDNKQGKASGTSMASPFTSGIAALSYGKYGPILQGRNMYTYLKYICTDITPTGRDNQTGHGIPYVIKMLETDPCDVQGIDCDGNPTPPEEPEEKPEDPVDNPPDTPEPPKEDPTPPAPTPTKSVTITVEGRFMRYRRENQEGWSFLYVPEMQLTAYGDGPITDLYDSTKEFVDNYFFNSRIVLTPVMDYSDATEWTGQFLEYEAKNRGRNIQVSKVKGKDEYGREAIVTKFDRADLKLDIPDQMIAIIYGPRLIKIK